jgi:hypothetical protein
MDDNTRVQPCWGPSCVSVLEFGFQLISLVYRYWVDRTYTKFRIVPEFLECNYWVICEVSVLQSPSGEVNSTRLNGNVTQTTTVYMTSASDALWQRSTRLSVALMVSHKWLQQLVQFYVNNGSHQPHGVTAPSGPGPAPCLSFKLTLRHTLHPVGLLQTSKHLYVKTSIRQHTTLTTDIYAARGIRTRDSSQQTAEDLRPRGHWNRLMSVSTLIKLSRQECPLFLLAFG